MTPTSKRIAARARASRDQPLRHLLVQHPYLDAREGFLAGRMTKAQAVAMVLQDGAFKAECLMQSRDAEAHAKVIVCELWAAELVAAIQQRKREAAQ